jgi:hypothetical protein
LGSVPRVFAALDPGLLSSAPSGRVFDAMILVGGPVRGGGGKGRVRVLRFPPFPQKEAERMGHGAFGAGLAYEVPMMSGFW